MKNFNTMTSEDWRKFQSRLLDCCFAAQRNGNTQALTEFNRLYDVTVDRLMCMLGVDADCWLVDTALFEQYSDAHKERYGVRGRAVLSSEATQEWLNWHRNLPENEF